MGKRNKDINREEMFSKTKEITNHYENKVILDNNAICVQADCMDFLNNLKQKNIIVDAIITDPPYNISKPNNFNTLNRVGIDFGEWDKNFDITAWINIASYLVKPGGTIIVFSAWREMGDIARVLEDNGFIVKTMLRWEKKNPMPRNVNRLYVSDVEYAIWAIKNGGTWTFNKGNCSYRRPKYESGVVCGKERLGHPTQKSINIMKEIIETHTNENDIILDPFSGSFTTMESSIILKRKFLGCELDKKWIKVAENRYRLQKEQNKI